MDRDDDDEFMLRLVALACAAFSISGNGSVSANSVLQRAEKFANWLRKEENG